MGPRMKTKKNCWCALVRNAESAVINHIILACSLRCPFFRTLVGFSTPSHPTNYSELFGSDMFFLSYSGWNWSPPNLFISFPEFLLAGLEKDLSLRTCLNEPIFRPYHIPIKFKSMELILTSSEVTIALSCAQKDLWLIGFLVLL